MKTDIRTIQDVFDTVTLDNFNNFFDGFQEVVANYLFMVKCARGQMEKEGKKHIHLKNTEVLPISCMPYIDDGKQDNKFTTVKDEFDMPLRKL